MTRQDILPLENGSKMPLGFCFSFPMEQLGINEGKLITWTKRYDVKDAIGQNISALLQAELDERVN